MQRPRYIPTTPQIFEAQLVQLEAAADTITQVSHVIRMALGVKTANRTLKLYHAIMREQFLLKQDYAEERLAVSQGKGTRAPNGTRRARDYHREIQE